MGQMKPTPEQARDLIAHFGSQRAAARELAIPLSTLRAWLDPESNRARAARWYAANTERKCEAMREHYWSLSGVDYARKMLLHRRWEALRRRAERQQRKEATVGPL
jgi:hypothetical protein